MQLKIYTSINERLRCKSMLFFTFFKLNFIIFALAEKEILFVWKKFGNSQMS